MAPKKKNAGAAAAAAPTPAAAAAPKAAPAPAAAAKPAAAPAPAPAPAAAAKPADVKDAKSAPAAAGAGKKKPKENIHHKLPMSDPARWFIIYPAYINAKLSPAQGRKIALKDCVERPSIPDIMEICKLAKLPFKPEPKAYSRDFHQLGRVRVQLLRDDKTPINPQFAKRIQFLRFCGTQIPLLKNRVAAAQQEDEAEALATAGKSRKGKKHRK